MSSYQFDYFDFQPSPLGSVTQSNPLSDQGTPTGLGTNRGQQVDMYNARMNSSLNTSNLASVHGGNSGANYYNEIEKLKLQLNLKSQIINNLTKKLNNRQVNGVGIQNLVPAAFYKAFKETANELRLKSSECDSLSEHLESLIVANTDNHEDLTHKMIKKLNYLVSENEALMEMISNSSKSSLMIELGICKNELNVLKEKLKNYEAA